MQNQFDPNYWYARADEARARAEEMHDEHARRTMLQIAKMYSGMALRIEVRLAEKQAADQGHRPPSGLWPARA